MSKYDQLKALHDELVHDFRSRAARSRQLHEESAVRHQEQLEIAATRRRTAGAFAERLQQQESERRANAASRLADETMRHLDGAEETLRRLGLDSRSVEQQRLVAALGQGAEAGTPALVASPPRSGRESGFSGGGADDAMSARMSVYSRRSRKGSQQQPAAVHPLAAGLNSVLRRTNDHMGVTGVQLNTLSAHTTATGRAKLTGPRPLYPTIASTAEALEESSSDEDAEPGIDGLLSARETEAYLESIRARRAVDVAARKDRQVRGHRQQAEQARNRNDVVERQELNRLLADATARNKVDRLEALNSRREAAVRAQQQSEAARSIQRQVEARARLAASAIAVAEEEAALARAQQNLAHLTARTAAIQHEEAHANAKHAATTAHCAETVKALVDMAMEVITRGSSLNHDGTPHYRRAVLSVSEWRELINYHVHGAATDDSQDALPERTGAPSGPSPASKALSPSPGQRRLSNASAPTSPLPAKAAALATPSAAALTLTQELVSLDVVGIQRAATSTMEALVADRLLQSPSEDDLRDIPLFVVGDAVLSGVEVLSQASLGVVHLAGQRKHMLLSPRLLRHIFFLEARRALTDEISEIAAQRYNAQVELASRSQSAASNAKGRKEVKNKESNPQSAAIQQLAAQLADLQQQILAKQHAMEALTSRAETDAAAPATNDDEIGTLVGKLLSLRADPQSARHLWVPTVPPGEDSGAEPVPLCLGLLCGHALLANTPFIFAGFPLTPAFFAALAAHYAPTSAPVRVGVVQLRCTPVTLLSRLSQRLVYRKQRPRPPPEPVADADAKKKRGAKEPAPPPRVEALPPPVDTLAHPLLSPLELHKEKIAPASPPSTAPLPGMRNATPTSTKRTSLGSTPTPTPPAAHAMEVDWSSSPFLTTVPCERDTEFTTVLKVCGWGEGAEGSAHAWLYAYVHRTLPAEEAAAMQAVREAGAQQCRVIDLGIVVDDAAEGLFSGCSWPARGPGHAAIEPAEVASHLSQVRSVRGRLCDIIIREWEGRAQIRADDLDPELAATSELTTDLVAACPDLRPAAEAARRSLTAALTILEAATQQLRNFLGSETLAYPSATFLRPPPADDTLAGIVEASTSEDAVAFARLRQCNEERRRCIRVVDGIIADAAAAIAAHDGALAAAESRVRHALDEALGASDATGIIADRLCADLVAFPRRLLAQASEALHANVNAWNLRLFRHYSGAEPVPPPARIRPQSTAEMLALLVPGSESVWSAFEQRDAPALSLTATQSHTLRGLLEASSGWSTARTAALVAAISSAAPSVLAAHLASLPTFDLERCGRRWLVTSLAAGRFHGNADAVPYPNALEARRWVASLPGRRIEGPDAWAALAWWFSSRTQVAALWNLLHDTETNTIDAVSVLHFLCGQDGGSAVATAQAWLTYLADVLGHRDQATAFVLRADAAAEVFPPNTIEPLDVEIIGFLHAHETSAPGATARSLIAAPYGREMLENISLAHPRLERLMCDTQRGA